MTPSRPARWAVPLAFALVACGGDGDSPTSTPQPTTGTVQVSATTAGDTLDQDGYAVALGGGAEQTLDLDGTVTFENVAEGDHEVAISDVQVNCTTDGGATRTVAVAAGSTATTSFDVSCDPALFDRVVFHRDDGAGDGDLLLVAPDGSGVTAIRGGDGFDLFPSISPDGTRVAFQDRSGADSEIAVVDVDGSSFVQLTDNDAFDGSTPTWAPDGSRIAFSSDRDGDSEIYVMDAEGSNVVQLTDNDVFDVGPAWSPDGSRIAFASDLSGTRDIHVVDATGGAPTRLTDDASSETGPAWSPDGTRIAFQRGGDLYVMDADGSGVEPLAAVSGGSDQGPAWSPDGSRLVFTSDPDGDHELYVVDADGTGLTKLLDAPATDERLGSWGAARSER